MNTAQPRYKTEVQGTFLATVFLLGKYIDVYKIDEHMYCMVQSVVKDDWYHVSRPNCFFTIDGAVLGTFKMCQEVERLYELWRDKHGRTDAARIPSKS